MDFSNSPALIVTTTADSKTHLEEIARQLVEKKLAACCQISGPATSIYRWQGKIDSADEWLCTVKTVPALVESLIVAIKEIHSYDEPEIIVTPIVGGSESYLKWIKESVDHDSASD